MSNIDDIMDMLDWNQPEHIQAEGRRLAKDVRCINVFLQPGSREHCKNVWDNCAQILSERSDEELKPYVGQLLEWLLDMNWPGAACVFERLTRFKDRKWLKWILEERMKEAEALKEEIWLFNMQQLHRRITMCDA